MCRGMTSTAVLPADAGMLGSSPARIPGRGMRRCGEQPFAPPEPVSKFFGVQIDPDIAFPAAMRIEPRPFDDPDVQELVAEVQLEYVRRYGGPDETELLPGEFSAPAGAFLLAHVQGRPVGIGGWRAHDAGSAGLRDGDAEIKRMYVRTDARRRGVARRVLDALERSAAEAGRRRMVLETGTEQPEALALYASAGYRPMTERYGRYADQPTSLYYCKELPPIRRATDADLPVLQEIERSAGLAFAEIGMDAVAEDEPPTLDELRAHAGGIRVWCDSDDRPVAYLTLGVVDGAAHVEQVSVHPDHARRGVGRALLDHAAGRARDAGFAALTLTTFRDVAWNAPYYARLGFEVVGDESLSPGLHDILAEEARHGLGRWPRVAMRRPL